MQKGHFVVWEFSFNILIWKLQILGITKSNSKANSDVIVYSKVTTIPESNPTFEVGLKKQPESLILLDIPYISNRKAEPNQLWKGIWFKEETSYNEINYPRTAAFNPISYA